MGVMFGILVLLGYGLFFMIWPEKGREWYLRPFDVDAPSRWYKPSTWLNLKPDLIIFRIIGGVAICLGLVVLYLWKHSQ
jgi:uncharacterized protein YjeT (DUF2065 family)